MGIVSENFEDVSLDMVAVLLWEQQLFPNLMEWGKPVYGNMNMIVCNSSSYNFQLSSPYGVCYTSTIWYNKARVAQAGVVDTCPNDCLTFLDRQLPSM